MKELRDRILEYRAKNNITQTKFAELCGITLQTISQIERGYQHANRLTRAKIELVLNEKDTLETERKEN